MKAVLFTPKHREVLLESWPPFRETEEQRTDHRGLLFSFLWGASQGAPRKGERSANACQVVKMSVSFPKASVLLEGVDAASGC